jgi:hypothetical protein
MRFLKQSSSVDLPIGPFLDDTDGKTAETGLTLTQPDIRLKKNGAAWAQKAAAQTLSHEENGNYEVTLDATDTDTLGQLRLHVIESGALPVWEDFMVLPANVWDSLFGSDRLQVDVQEWIGTAAATPTVAGVPEVDVTHIAGGTQTVTDLKDFADDGYDPSTNTVQGVVLTDTTTVAGSVSGAVGSVTGAVGSVTARVTANVDQLGGVAQSLTDLKDFADDGYDPSTNKVQGVVLADTVTTLTGHTAQTGDAYARLGAPAGASVSADVAAIKTDSGNLISRLGAFTGTGVNTVLGFLKAALSKVASTPSDVGGTFDASTDSTEALRDRGDAAWTTGGGGSAPTVVEIREEMDANSLLPSIAAEAATLAANMATVLSRIPSTVALDSTGAKQATLSTVSAAVASLLSTASTLTAQDIEDALEAALRTDTIPELSQGIPSATPTFAAAMALLYMMNRNGYESTATAQKFKDDAGTVIMKRSASDDGTTLTVGEMVSGP